MKAVTKKPTKVKKTPLPKDTSAILTSLRKRWLLALCIAALGIIIMSLALFWPGSNKSIQLQSTQGLAATDQCAKKKATTYTCYKNELTKITKEQSPEKAMALLKEQYSKVDYVKSQCHQLTHVIGRAALAKYGGVAGTYTHGDQFCWSGYYHGAMEQVATQNGYDYIVKNANSICAPIAAKNPHSFYHYNCVHGLGHGFMFVKNGDLFTSLRACDAINDSWERSSCYGGVFMQNIMNEQTPDADARTKQAYLKADEPMYPCTAVETRYKDQCYLMQTSYALQTVNYDFSKVFKLCSEVEQPYNTTCYTSLGRDASGNSISNVAQTRKTCLLGPSYEAQYNCVRGAAMDFVSYFHSDQQAKELCASLPPNLSSDCLQVVSSYYATF